MGTQQGFGGVRARGVVWGGVLGEGVGIEGVGSSAAGLPDVRQRSFVSAWHAALLCTCRPAQLTCRQRQGQQAAE